MYSLGTYLEFLSAMVLAVTPAVLFLLFYRGLMALRDDQLIQRLAEEFEQPSESSDQSALMHLDVGDGGASGPSAVDSAPAPVQCPSCGAANAPVADYCHDCLSEL